MNTFLRGLKNKEVINVTSGKRVGFVTDVELDMTDARLVSLVVAAEGGSIFSKPRPTYVPWTCIQHVGEDLIIVKLKDIVES
jgi:YlmC/YmxH family sporulation protein